MFPVLVIAQVLSFFTRFPFGKPYSEKYVEFCVKTVVYYCTFVNYSY